MKPWALLGCSGLCHRGSQSSKGRDFHCQATSSLAHVCKNRPKGKHSKRQRCSSGHSFPCTREFSVYPHPQCIIFRSDFNTLETKSRPLAKNPIWPLGPCWAAARSRRGWSVRKGWVSHGRGAGPGLCLWSCSLTALLGGVSAREATGLPGTACSDALRLCCAKQKAQWGGEIVAAKLNCACGCPKTSQVTAVAECTLLLLGARNESSRPPQNQRCSVLLQLRIPSAEDWEGCRTKDVRFGVNFRCPSLDGVCWTMGKVALCSQWCHLQWCWTCLVNFEVPFLKRETKSIHENLTFLFAGEQRGGEREKGCFQTS